MSLLECIILLYVHYEADFIWQDKEWADNKSHSLSALLKHTAVYSLIWLIVLALITDFYGAFLFATITFVLHTITDYGTSKWTSKLFKEQRYNSSIPSYGAFPVIGFDQFLHYLQLFLTYDYIFGN